MKRLGFVLLFVLAVGGVTPPAGASHPDLLRSYRFLPARSVLYQSLTDREAPTIPISISGTFDLVTGLMHDFDDDPDPWVGQFAKFENVRAGGPHPIQDYIVDLDQVLNLSGLEGRQLPAGAPWDVFGFSGTTADGSSVWLIASVIGQWFMLNGQTTPADGNALVYEINAVARQRPYADFNDDGTVDGADLARLTANIGATSLDGDATHLGDANGDGSVDGADYLAWQQHVGEKSPWASLASAAAVPEPASAVLFVAGFAAGWQALVRVGMRSHVAAFLVKRGCEFRRNSPT